MCSKSYYQYLSFDGADLVLDGAPDIEPNGEKTLVVSVYAHRALGDEVINLNCRWWLPEGFVVNGGQTAIITQKNSHDSGIATLKYTLKTGERIEAVNRLVLEIMPMGRCMSLYVSVVLLG